MADSEEAVLDTRSFQWRLILFGSVLLVMVIGIFGIFPLWRRAQFLCLKYGRKFQDHINLEMKDTVPKWMHKIIQAKVDESQGWATTWREKQLQKYKTAKRSSDADRRTSGFPGADYEPGQGGGRTSAMTTVVSRVQTRQTRQKSESMTNFAKQMSAYNIGASRAEDDSAQFRYSDSEPSTDDDEIDDDDGEIDDEGAIRKDASYPR